MGSLWLQALCRELAVWLLLPEQVPSEIVRPWGLLTLWTAHLGLSCWLVECGRRSRVAGRGVSEALPDPQQESSPGPSHASLLTRLLLVQGS